jgi:flagellar hook-associated protein 1
LGLNDVLNTARDALTAQTFGLTVTGQNISNVNTPGYVRREAILETRVLGENNYGSVNAAGIRRVADAFISKRHLELTGAQAEASARDDALTRVENEFDDADGTGIGQELSALLSAFSDLGNHPSDPTTRRTVLDRAQRFADRVRATDENLATYQSDLLQQARGVVSNINQQTDEIAALTAEINAAQARGEEPADLKDKRDNLLLSLSQLVDVTTFEDEQGQLNVRGAGITLVQGDRSRHLDLDLNAQGAARVLADNGSGAGSDVTRYLSGGQLSGLLQVRDTDVVEVRAELDTFAFDFASALNTQHAAGFGLDGSTGRPLFELSATASGAAASLALGADLVGHPERVAAASTLATVPGDASNALALSRVADQPLASGRTAAQAYAELVGDVGQRKHDAERAVDMRAAMTAQVQSMRESTSGVSLDEEMVALTKFQRAFEAASRVLTTADQLLADLINTFGR